MGDTATIPALRGLRQGDCEFKASLGYILRACFKKIIVKIKEPIKAFLSQRLRLSRVSLGEVRAGPVGGAQVLGRRLRRFR